MLWPMLAIALGFLGLAVLAVLAVRVFVEVRIADASGDLERAATDLARAGGAARP
ncbi:membrane protein [Streptomyces sp. NRRL S-444]|nr:membrane protein [Streptomyces sp. NRRL S-444]